MKRDVLSEEFYDEVCRVIGDAVIVLAEDGQNTHRSNLTSLLQQTHQHSSAPSREERKILEHAIRLVKQ